MFRTGLLTISICLQSLYSISQNDLDAIRYSRSGINGSARFAAMAGAFGAVGGDGSCAAYNPAGLAVFRKGELSFSGGLKITNNTGTLYNNSLNTLDAKFAYNNFSFVKAWASKADPESRNSIAFTNTQLQNFSNSVTMGGYTNSSSIVKDMATLANEDGSVNSLYSNYEGLAYQTYLLDNGGGQFVSLVDPKRAVLQNRNITTTGRANEFNFSYAYSYKDKFYFGASVGVPQVRYTSTTTHTESDDRDSMQIAFSPDSTTYTSTYIDGIPNLHSVYAGLGGFNSLSYTEYFKTSGYGLNLKLGGIVRINDFIRVGAYYHTPTIYYLNDVYYNTMVASFDKDPSNVITVQDPPDAGGYTEYKIITPSRISLNSAFIINKIAVIAVDYEFVNYRNAAVKSNTVDFSGVNNFIRTNYSNGNNLRVGAELNIQPVMLRAGYSMQGSPFGNSFTGTFVRHTLSTGLGFRTKNRWYFDFVLSKSFTTENYYLFTTLNTKALLKLGTTNFGVTVGVKF